MFDDEIVQYQKDKTAEAEKQLADYKAAKAEPEDEEDEEEPETKKDGETKKDDVGLARDDDGNLEKQSDAEDYFEKNKKAPSGWTNAGDEDKPELMTTKDFEKKKENKPEKKVTKSGIAAHTPPKQMNQKEIQKQEIS